MEPIYIDATGMNFGHGLLRRIVNTAKSAGYNRLEQWVFRMTTPMCAEFENIGMFVHSLPGGEKAMDGLLVVRENHVPADQIWLSQHGQVLVKMVNIGQPYRDLPLAVLASWPKAEWFAGVPG